MSSRLTQLLESIPTPGLRELLSKDSERWRRWNHWCGDEGGRRVLKSWRETRAFLPTFAENYRCEKRTRWGASTLISGDSFFFWWERLDPVAIYSLIPLIYIHLLIHLFFLSLGAISFNEPQRSDIPVTRVFRIAENWRRVSKEKSLSKIYPPPLKYLVISRRALNKRHLTGRGLTSVPKKKKEEEK